MRRFAPTSENDSPHQSLRKLIHETVRNRKNVLDRSRETQNTDNLLASPLGRMPQGDGPILEGIPDVILARPVPGLRLNRPHPRTRARQDVGKTIQSECAE